jgi:hypothetical protein
MITFKSSEPLESTPYFTPLSKLSKIFLPVKLESVLIFLIQGLQQMGLRCCGPVRL